MIDLRPLRTLPPEVADLVAESEAEGFRFVRRLVADWEAATVRFDHAGEVLLGAFDGDRLVAVGGLTLDPHDESRGVGRLRRVYVARALRRTGLGRRLVAALEAAAAPHFRELVLRTDTPDGAAFYERLGYLRLPSGGSATHRRLLEADPAGGGRVNQRFNPIPALPRPCR